MTAIYLATLFFSFVLSLVPSAQYLLDPVFGFLGLGAGFKTPFIDALIVIGNQRLVELKEEVRSIELLDSPLKDLASWTLKKLT